VSRRRGTILIVSSIFLKPGPAQRVDPGTSRLRAEPGRVEEKMGEEKTRCDSADPTS